MDVKRSAVLRMGVAPHVKARISGSPLVLAMATDAHREEIYRLRHAVYAAELGQHPPNARGTLTDGLDDFNVYVAATVDGVLAGFVSMTPPGRTYSIDKYCARHALPFPCDDGLFEIRLLTVDPRFRNRLVAPALMHAAFRWIEGEGGTHIVALGREQIVELYRAVGLEATGAVVQSGAVTYHLMHGRCDDVRAAAARRASVVRRIGASVDWRMSLPFERAPACYHGGAFFQAAGPRFDALERHERVINADVLDAWFPPAPGVLESLTQFLPWLVRTSPPTQCEGLLDTLAEVRGVPAASLLAGGGSSDLIFLAFGRWLHRGSRVLILDPMYGEYAHVLEQVVGCRVDRLVLRPEDGFRLDPERWLRQLHEQRYDLAVLVNPNSPTGQHVPRDALWQALSAAPSDTRVWVDETYVEYAGADQSMERLVVGRPGTVVCKSMSKVYALSGMRVGYLCGHADTITELRPWSPPWAVGLPAQVAAVRALQDPLYYAARWEQTHQLRAALASRLQEQCGLAVVSGVANFLLCRLREDSLTAAEVVQRARQADVFLRDAGGMGRSLGSHALRIAVRNELANERIVHVITDVLRQDADMREEYEAG